MESDWQFQALKTPPLVIFFCLGVLVFTGVISFLNWKRRGGKAVAALEFLRFAIVALILFTLCKPEFSIILPKETEPEVVILRDVSNSTTTRDVAVPNGDPITRAAWLDEQFQTNFWAGIEKFAKVTVQDFGMSGTTDTNQIKAGTDIYSALEAERKKNKNIKAIFMFSDGDWNAGESPVKAAEKLGLGKKKIPVFTLTIGSDKAQRDLILKSVNPPNFGLLGQQIAIPYLLESHLGEEFRNTSITLKGVNMKSGASVSITKPIKSIPEHGKVHGTIVWRPVETGHYTLTLSTPLWKKGDKKEVIQDNNGQTFQISIRTEPLKVLLIESYPRWEYRYLRNALTRDPGVDVSVLLLHPELGPGGGLNYIQKFPETREQLSKFDVVFLGDVGIGEKELTAEQCDLIRGLVDQQGSGLVFMPGQRGRQLTFLDHPLGDLIPVSYVPGEKDGVWAQREVSFKLTSTGKGHFLTMLASNEYLNDTIWKNLPGFYWCAAVERARPFAQVLATHSSKRNQAGYLPVLAAGSWGEGQVLFMGTDAAWRWRRGVEDLYHYRFWGQVVRWMARKRKMAQGKGVRLSYSPENPTVGDDNQVTKVTLVATLLDLSGDSENQTLRASIKSPDGQNRDLELRGNGEDWGVFQGKLAVTVEGEYVVKIYNPNGKQHVSAKILVEGVVREKLGQPANSEDMRKIAKASGGQSGGPKDLTKLLREITLQAENEVIPVDYRLWEKWWWGGIILLLLAVYWVCRKMMGLI